MENPIEILNSVLSNQRFRKGDWEERGLNPSPRRVISAMEVNFLKAIHHCIEKLRRNNQSRLQKEDLIEIVALLDLEEFDTEEQEWLVDLICEALSLIDNESADYHNWLDEIFGDPPFTEVTESTERLESSFVQSYRVENECQACKSTLNCLVKENPLQVESAGIAKCWTCQKHTIFYVPEGTSFLTSMNFLPVEFGITGAKEIENLSEKINRLNC